MNLQSLVGLPECARQSTIEFYKALAQVRYRSRNVVPRRQRTRLF